MAKVKKKDGTAYYYYYKKKRGRPKKRGPKKKKRMRGRRWQEPWDYKIILCNFKKQDRYIDKFHDLGEVEEMKEKLLKQNSTVEIPMLFVNNTRNSKTAYEYQSEYIVLRRIKNEWESNESMLKDQYGRFVKHTTTSEQWYVYDKFPCLKEEEFWVYGLNPRTDRKPIKWVYDNFIENYIFDDYNIIQIYLYNNKVIFRYHEDEINFIITKNIPDAIRVYNFLEEKYKKNRQVIFTGFTSGHSPRAQSLIKLIQNKTGWGLTKIYRKHT
jgi:hypothetical protein